MEYNIDDFTYSIMATLRDNAPFESDSINKSKHPKRGGKHLRDLFDPDQGTIEINLDTRIFDVGGYMAETLMPHYHILQNSETIHKRSRGTTKSKGSQDKISNVGMRDYERVSWNGKTFSKEYSKNVRGNRSKADKLREPKLRYSGGQYIEDRRSVSNSYLNVHYKYIDRILDATIPYIAQEYGLRALRKQDSGLEEEYNLQNQEDMNERFSVLEMLDSFE